MRALVFAVVLAACASKGGPTSPPGSPPPRDGEPAVNCTASDDCDLVDACCGCNAGGRKIALRKDAVAAFTASREQRCAGQMCAQHISTDASCDAEATCGGNNRCNVTPHMHH
jgi:hypothetical protein